jgi:hypothetical protein
MDTLAPEPNWLADIRAKSKARGTNKLSMTEINSIVSDVRRTAGKTAPASKK